MLWDIFCRVIDNYGDIGVCWRLSANLAARGERVRLWVDDASALHWMAPGAVLGQWPGVQVLPWRALEDVAYLAPLPAADVWIEGFGCEIPEVYLRHSLDAPGTDSTDSPTRPPVWINLEYLSAEAYVERAHGLPSPVMSGPAKGCTKHFFYPGFTGKTGGLLREDCQSNAMSTWDAEARRAWLAHQGIAWRGERLVSLFCYEPPALESLLKQLAADPTPTLLLVTAGRANAAVAASATSAIGALHLHFLPPLTQSDFDRLLWSCDLNFVRGEDSVVRALWAGKPFVWHIYPQDDGAHGPKLDAFLDLLQMPESVRQYHQVWNGLVDRHRPNFSQDEVMGERGAGSSPITRASAHAVLPLADVGIWQKTIETARARLFEQVDLTRQLTDFVAKKR